MSDAMRDDLERAYNLIQQEQLDEAVNVLRPIVAREPDNPDAWWLLANAVNDPHDAHNALTNVLRLEPQHEQAQELLNNLLQEYPDLGATAGTADDAFDMFSTASSGLRSTQQLTATDWDAEFGSSSSSTGFEADTSTPDDDLDNLFRNIDTSSIDLDSLTANEPTSAVTDSGSYEIDTFFAAETDEGEDLDAMFKSDIKNVPGTRTESTDLDAMFGVKQSARPEPVEADAFTDPFGANEPDFLDDIVVPTEVAATIAAEDKRRTQTGKLTTRSSSSVPKGDPFAPARSQRRSPLLPILLGILVIAAIGIGAYVVLTRPGAEVLTPTQVASNDLTPAATSDATAEATIEAVGNATTEADPAVTAASQPVLTGLQDLLAGANFAAPTVALENGTFAVTTCELPGRNLRTRLNEALDLIAQEAAKIREQVQTAQIELRDCARPENLLYRASASIDALTSYVDGGQTDAATYRAAWAAN